MDKIKLYGTLKKTLTILFWTGVATVFIWVVAKTNNRLNHLSVQQTVIKIKPEDPYFISEKEINNILKNNTLKTNKTYININLQNLEDLIKSNVYVKDAECYMDMSGIFYAEIVQRQPFIRVFRFNGESYFIDKNGIKIPLHHKQTSHCIVANGNIFERYEEAKGLYSAALNEVYKIATYVDNDEFFKDQIDQIFVQANNEFVLVPKVGKQVVLLGSTDELEDKLNRLKVFYRYGLNKVGWSKYKQINLKYKNQIICSR